MNCSRILVLLVIHGLIMPFSLFAQDLQKVSIVWKNDSPKGKIEVANGHVKKVGISKGNGKVDGDHFHFLSTGENRIFIEIDRVQNHTGPEATLVSVKTDKTPFSFFLRDVNQNFPIYMPDYGLAVLNNNDNRSYEEVESELLARKLKTKIQNISSNPESSFDAVSNKVRNMTAPTWLGISRDFRIFELSESLTDVPRGEANFISPKRSSTHLTLKESGDKPISYSYLVGRGVGVQNNISRRLEDGVMPILHSIQQDDDIKYHNISFVSLEKSPLTTKSPIGTDFLVAESYSIGHMLTEAQTKLLNQRKDKVLNTEEETVFYFQSKIVNSGTVPRYAWFRVPRPSTGWHEIKEYAYDKHTGFSKFNSGKVFCVSKLNGKPIQNEEMAVLLQPGEQALLEFYVPHSPVSNDRAIDLARQSFSKRYTENKTFWAEKLKAAAKIRLPEKRIEEMLQAGLLHLDLITYGKNPDSTMAANIGIYSPIGTESAPIIQYYASMGLQDNARRSLNFFLDQQHEDGFMQNFGGYMVETGSALWTMGEYFRYTNDKKWATSVASKLLKSCDYLIQWRNRNKKEELRGKGYGMIEGKVADPEDHFHQFMLNGYAYLGLSRIAEILTAIGSPESARISKEAAEWKADIRTSFFAAIALSPVVPLGDGTWSPTAPAWTEAKGPRALYMKPETFWSHGTFTVSDAMLGPLYLVFCEVLDVNEPGAKMLLNYNSELFYQDNSAFSQPYYSRHNWVQAKLGMVKPFLNTYYNTFAAAADRETYTFWEHLYKLSPHKTHEEAWFLMETRWMLYMEDGNTLNLLKTIPRVWMADGEEVVLDGVQSYFGKLNFKASSHVAKGYIEALIECDSERKPEEISIRLPHPDYKKPIKVIGGIYDEKTETVTVKPFSGKASVRLEY